MSPWAELLLDLLTLLLVAAGAWLIYPPAGLIVAGAGVGVLNYGLKVRLAGKPEARGYRAVEIDGP